jgi:hypothetical protein
VREDGSVRGCRFCNLNLQWRGYRAKSPERPAEEIRQLAKRHKVVSFVFQDNVQPRVEPERLFRAIRYTEVSCRLFAELRAPLKARQIREMRAAGLRKVQIGIEALATSLLRKIDKGVRAIDNVNMMKLCHEYGIESDSNLLLEFPGSDEADVAETLRVMEFVRYFQPLHFVSFWLGEGSGACRCWDEFRLSAIRNHPNYKALFPPEILEKLDLMQKDFRGGKTFQKKLWRPVTRALKKWQEEYARVQHSNPGEPHLSYLDGGDFLMVHQRRGDSRRWQTFRLSKPARAVYLFCSEPVRFSQIREAFPDLTEERIGGFLEEMERIRLIFREDDAYLSLAVNEDVRRFIPSQAEGVVPHRAGVEETPCKPVHS